MFRTRSFEINNQIIIYIQKSRMREENENIDQLDILCIGEIQAGKSYFLKQYTKDQGQQTLQNTYDIYARKVQHRLVYFHELSEEENLYLQKEYDGILFFVDLVGTWNVVQNILKWMELQSRLTGMNIYKIPLRVIITKTRTHKNDEKWKKCLQSELSSLVYPHQIIYFQSIEQTQTQLQSYFRQICEGKAEGIKSTNQNHIRLYGLSQILKFFAINVKLTFFRCAQVFEKHVRSKLNLSGKLKIN